MSNAAKPVLLVVALVLAVLAAATAAAPAPAQTSGDFPEYVLEEDGTVVIDGDGATDCTTFATGLEQGYLESGGALSAGARRVLEQCVEAGLLDPELAASAGAPASASTSPEVAGASEGDGGLPDTGGLNLPATLLTVFGVLVVTGGLLARKVITG